ncbi:hypothetical protein GCM10020256_55130 [Streptomyces thermocoprophilus]
MARPWRGRAADGGEGVCRGVPARSVRRKPRVRIYETERRTEDGHPRRAPVPPTGQVALHQPPDHRNGPPQASGARGTARPAPTGPQVKTMAPPIKGRGELRECLPPARRWK